MAYWWACLNQSYRKDREAGILWTPDVDESGKTPFHWATMTEVRPGDVIFCYVRQRITSVAVAKNKARDSSYPPDPDWDREGKCLDVEYWELEKPLAIRDVVSKLIPLLQAKHSPFNRNNTVNNGYLYGVSPRAGPFLLDQINADQSGAAIDVVEAGLEQSVQNTTERKALVDSRLGQGQFRDRLMTLWGGQRAVTGLDLPSVLRASHIKPWRDSDNRERLDPYNGLLLSPSYDAVFDAGFVTFDNGGKVIFAKELSPTRASIMGISPDSRIEGLHQRHLEYVDFHRQSVFLDS